jgi:hypothetical protein
LTAVFGVSALALATIAIACLQLARSDVIASRRHWERLQDHYAAEGLTNLAAWRLLHMDETAAVSWREPMGAGVAEVFAEPEARKLSLAEAGGTRGAQRLIQVFGEDTALRLAPKLTALAARRDFPSRDELAAVDLDPLWRSCGLTVVSAHSRLTDVALSDGVATREGAYRPRDGEVWRIVVIRADRVQIDRLLRFTGDRDEPVATINELAATTSPEGCLARLQGGSP